MPVAVAAVSAAFTAIGGWATVSAIASIAMAGYATYQAKKFAQGSAQKSQRDYQTTLKQSIAPVRRVYGRSAGGGVLNWVEEEQTTRDNQRIKVCVVTAGHEIDGLETIWFGDDVAYSTTRGISSKLISTQGEGYGDYSTLTRISDTVFVINDYKSWKLFKNGFVGVTLMVKANQSSEFVGYTIQSVAQETTGSGNTLRTVGTRVTVSGTLPTSLGVAKVGRQVFTHQEANNPQVIGDVPSLLTSSGQWTDDMIGKGLHYVAFQLTYDNSVFPQGLPTFKFERRGCKLYDPRKDSTRGGSGSHRLDNPSTWEWSENAALVILDLHTQVYDYTADEIDFAAFMSAATQCEFTTPVDGEVHRFAINGEFDLDEGYSEVVASMLAACHGSKTMVAGKLGIRVGQYQGVPTNTITDSQIISDVSIQPEVSYQDRVNNVTVVYKDPAQQYTETDADPAKDDSIIEQDGALLTQSLDVSKWVSSKRQAEYLAWIHFRKARDRRGVNLSTNLSMLPAVAGSVVDLSFSTLNIAGDFLVQEWSFGIQDGITLDLIKEDESYYDPNPQYVPPTHVIYDREQSAVPKVTGLTYTESPERENQGTLTWNEVEEHSYRVEIYRNDTILFAQSTSNPSYVVTGLQNVPHAVRVYCVNSIGQTGDETYLSFTPTEPPKQFYTWIAYADNASGGGISTSPTNKSYIGHAYNRLTPTIDISDPSVYTWALYKGADGSDGRDGSNGSDGADGKTWAYYDSWDSAAIPNPSQANLNSWFQSVTGRARLDSDVLFCRDLTPPNPPVTGYVEVKAFQFKGSWVQFVSVINGNQIVNGSLLGINISSKTTVTAGSGSKTAGMNGDDTYGPVLNGSRFWAGSEFPRNTSGDIIAPYHVDDDGRLVATEALINGIINAVTGNIEERMTVGNSYIDGRTNQDFLHAGTDKFRVTHNGELYAEEGTFGGEVQADKISGDIVSAIVKPATLRTSSVTQSNQQADTSTVSSFTVTTGRPYIRTLVTYSTCSLDLHPSSSARAEGNAWAVVYGTGSGGSGNLSEVRSAAVHHAVGSIDSGGSDEIRVQLKTVPITIPANWTGTVYLKGRIRHAGVSGSSATVALSGNMIDGTQAMAQLFKSGSDLA